MNRDQLEYLFRVNSKDGEVVRSDKPILVENEKAKSHFFMRKQRDFDPNNPSHLDSSAIPKLPQILEMVNQTVSIPQEPEKSNYLWRNIIEYSEPTEEDLERFNGAVKQKEKMRTTQQKTKEDL